VPTDSAEKRATLEAEYLEAQKRFDEVKARLAEVGSIYLKQ
jgi:hypothetical protein